MYHQAFECWGLHEPEYICPPRPEQWLPLFHHNSVIRKQWSNKTEQHYLFWLKQSAGLFQKRVFEKFFLCVFFLKTYSISWLQDVRDSSSEKLTHGIIVLTDGSSGVWCGLVAELNDFKQTSSGNWKFDTKFGNKMNFEYTWKSKTYLINGLINFKITEQKKKSLWVIG